MIWIHKCSSSSAWGREGIERGTCQAEGWVEMTYEFFFLFCLGVYVGRVRKQKCNNSSSCSSSSSRKDGKGTRLIEVERDEVGQSK